MSDNRLDAQTRLTRRATICACIASILIVALDLWHNRHLFDPEGITYLDMADAYYRGDWHAALVGNWAPFFPWMLALMMALFAPPPQWEFTAVHLLNFVVYLGTLGCFSLFLQELLKLRREDGANREAPAWCWAVFGYALFTWSIVRMIPPHQPQPDLLTCAWVYLIFALLLRFHRGLLSWRAALLFGLVLALAYFTKAIMFPMGFVFLGVAGLLALRAGRDGGKIFAALAVFLVVSLPYIVALSQANGRWLYSDNWRLNYAWELEQAKRFVHWQGERKEYGTPTHPTRKLRENPPVYEFARPFKVTYPPWYNPSYWYDGVQPAVDLRRHLSAVVKNIKDITAFLASATGSAVVKYRSWGGLETGRDMIIGPLLSILAVIALVLLERRSALKALAAHWFLLLPVAALLGAYGLLHYDGRYIAAFVVVLWMVLFRAVALPYSDESQRFISRAIACAALLIVVTLAPGSGEAAWSAARSFFGGGGAAAGRFQSGHPNWQVVRYLNAKGVHAGANVGAVGWTLSAYWARMGRMHIIAEVPADGALEFWSADGKTKAEVMQLFRQLGAKAVVARSGYINAHQLHEWDLQGLPGRLWPIPADDSAGSTGTRAISWQHIEGTDYYVHVFDS